MPIHDWTRVNASIFHDFHHEWISTIKRALNAGLLSPNYYALVEQIAGGPGFHGLTRENVRPTLVLEPGFNVGEDTAEPEQYARKRNRVVIRHSSGDRAVAMIEIVSPGNKASRHALRSFVEKAAELLEAGIHLLIVDLFPPGPRDPQGIHGAIWSEIIEDHFQLPPDKALTLVAYSAGDRKCAYIEPVAVGDELPEMPLFLEPDIYVPVALEATYQSAWNAVPRRWRDELEG